MPPDDYPEGNTILTLKDVEEIIEPVTEPGLRDQLLAYLRDGKKIELIDVVQFVPLGNGLYQGWLHKNMMKDRDE